MDEKRSDLADPILEAFGVAEGQDFGENAVFWGVGVYCEASVEISAAVG